MFRLASSLIASATLVFAVTSMLGTGLAYTQIRHPGPRNISQPRPAPKVIATVVAHGHLHDGSAFSVHGL